MSTPAADLICDDPESIAEHDGRHWLLLRPDGSVDMCSAALDKQIELTNEAIDQMSQTIASLQDRIAEYQRLYDHRERRN